MQLTKNLPAYRQLGYFIMKTKKQKISIEQIANNMQPVYLSKEEAIRRGNDGQNQEIKSRFIDREVYCNVGTLAEYVLSTSELADNPPFSIDDIENYYYLPTEDIIYNALKDWDEKEEDFKMYANDPDTYNRRVKTSGDFEVFLKSLDDDDLKTFCDDFEYEYEDQAHEIFEWWAVSSYLFDKLKAEGYPVVECGTLYIWGRTTTGQAILLDGVITRICADMEILEGQSNSWAKK